MSTETIQDATFSAPSETTKLVSSKTKRDVIQFAGEKPEAIDMGWVQRISRNGTMVIVDFVFSKSHPYECETEQRATEVYNILLQRLAGIE